MNTVLINLLGAPGVGKTTLAFQLTGLLKSFGVLAEYAPEAMKYHIYRGTAAEAAKNQDKLLEEQIDNIMLFYGKVEVVVTDSPILMQMAYHTPENSTEQTKQTTIAAAKALNRMNVVVYRNHPYDQRHRFQTEEEANVKHLEILELLNTYEKDNYFSVMAGSQAASQIFNIYNSRVKNEFNRN